MTIVDATDQEHVLRYSTVSFKIKYINYHSLQYAFTYCLLAFTGYTHFYKNILKKKQMFHFNSDIACITSQNIKNELLKTHSCYRIILQ